MVPERVSSPSGKMPTRAPACSISRAAPSDSTSLRGPSLVWTGIAPVSLKIGRHHPQLAKMSRDIR
jgi:hypothetical protein